MLRQQTLLTKRVFSAVSATGTSGATGTFLLPEFDAHSVTFKLQVSAVTGTSPTLDLHLQTTDDNGNTWYDMVAFSQITASSATPSWATCAIDHGTNVVHGPVGTGISAGALGVPMMNRLVRAYGTIAGTSPMFTFTLDAYLPNVEYGS